MLSSGLVLLIGGGYVALLFVIAFVVDRLAAAGRSRALFSGVTYTLSLAVYCTSWTFYGAVGTAVRGGLEFVTIYTGPTLLLMAWWLLLRKMVRVAKTQRITSIADFVSARYGKSRTVAVLVTAIAIASVTPYIALQLLAVSRSFAVLVGESAADTAFWVAAAMAFFVVIFGARRLNADESQPGIVAAIAFESIVKLTALLAVAVFAVTMIDAEPVAGATFSNWHNALAEVGALPADGGVRWLILTTLSAAAMVCLPRQFQVGVLENRDEKHIALASWLFPLYLFLTAIAVLPIAVAGLTRLPAGTEPDLFVLTLPLAEGAHGLALFAFIGGLSAATSMVIVASLALAVMISNHLVAPLLLRKGDSGATSLSASVLMTRRIAIAGVLGLGYVYSRTAAGGVGLASIGLIAFAGVAQFAPALIGGLFWRDATRAGAVSGLTVGALAWLATLLVPSFGAGTGLLAMLRTVLLPGDMVAGAGAVDPLVFGVVVSLSLNTLLYVTVSLATSGSAMERLQATLFVDALSRGGPEPMLRRSANRRDLLHLTQRILGPAEAHKMFGGGGDDAVDSAFVARVEREIAFAVGAASAHTLVTRVATGEPLTVDAALSLLGETQDAIRIARDLGVRSVELERTAEELRAANVALTELLADKDDFLSRVSHEMRTPLTAVRAFADLLRDGGLDEARADRFLAIIASESERLTRLLDDILDLSRLEAGRAPIKFETLDATRHLQQAAAAMEGFAARQGVTIELDAAVPLWVRADADRLTQVLENLVSNAVKFHGTSDKIALSGVAEGATAVLRVIDHGPGVGVDVRPRLFTKFSGTGSENNPSGAGLGLAIAHEIVAALGGTLVLERTGADGSVFAVRLPLAAAVVSA
ncbi:sensor histidine kinase [Acuticoccus sp. MNP-M23]|uniref:sensor histidine kinase n=1 Tax=Acuticoccus sp. MNP-M23 TaxID=3072793 RepID=UPI0028154050|nr:sensor histidine kinase [Acuticoccus sp. MNP-M23]WMS41218.1 sensor histidine kinase [Acuticoccus sp. MNP-M23]